ncbi:putative G2/mitotic-specific cyclin, partial [Baffinella frigidus]
RPAWSPTLAKHTRYTEADLAPTVQLLATLHGKASGSAQKAAHKKYSSTRFQGVAAIEPLPGFAA